MRYWFGPRPFGSLCDEAEQIPVPLACCAYCDEPFGEDDIGLVPFGDFLPHHHECWMRLIVGSVQHQLKLCSCYGGVDIDFVDGQSKRAEAKEAVAYFYAHYQPPSGAQE